MAMTALNRNAAILALAPRIDHATHRVPLGIAPYDRDDYQQDAWVAALECWNRYNPAQESTFKTFFMARLPGALADSRRKQSYGVITHKNAQWRQQLPAHWRTWTIAMSRSMAPSPEQLLVEVEPALLLAKCVAALPHSLRSVYTLYVEQGCSMKSISIKLGLTESGVYLRYKALCQALAVQLSSRNMVIRSLQRRK
jgi:RNA polymerase sigma factor (sigma-70 family)